MADTGATNPVRCRCGGIRRPTEMLEVRGLGVGADFLCTACVEDLFRKGVEGIGFPRIREPRTGSWPTRRGC
jgi:hypothetical protein